MDDQTLQRALAGHKKLSAVLRREMLEPEALRGGNDNTLWSTLESSISNLSRRHKANALPAELFEAELHDIWYMYILAAQSIDADHPAQDRLLRIIQQADWELCGFDVLGTPVTGSSLPYLLEDVRAAWKALMEPSASFEKRCNMAGAIARLAGGVVCDGRFTACGLGIMKQALETPPSPAQDQTQHRLALVRIWLRYAGRMTLEDCLEAEPDYPEAEDTWAAGGELPGPLAQAYGVDAFEPWSEERFLFWKDTLVSMGAGIQDVDSMEVKCANNISLIWNVHFGILE